MTPHPDPRKDTDERRKRARRTAAWIAAVAVGIYVVFILSGVVAQ